jgi:hypothetical protein
VLTLAQIEEVVQKEKVQVKLRAQEKTDGFGNQQVQQKEDSENEDDQCAGGDASLILGGRPSSSKQKDARAGKARVGAFKVAMANPVASGSEGAIVVTTNAAGTEKIDYNVIMWGHSQKVQLAGVWPFGISHAEQSNT